MTTKINLLAVSLFLPVFISAQNVIPEPAQYRPAKGEFVLSIAENKALETNNVLPSRVVQRIAPDCTTGADEAYRLEITPDSVFIQSATVTGAFRGEETLKQLLRSGKGTTSACVINDAPRYSWRGFYARREPSFLWQGEKYSIVRDHGKSCGNGFPQGWLHPPLSGAENLKTVLLTRQKLFHNRIGSKLLDGILIVTWHVFNLRLPICVRFAASPTDEPENDLSLPTSTDSEIPPQTASTKKGEPTRRTK